MTTPEYAGGCKISEANMLLIKEALYIAAIRADDGNIRNNCKRLLKKGENNQG